INAALMLFYSFGAIGGPFAASAAMQYFGPGALFVFSAVVYAVLILVILYRMQVRSGVPAGRRSPFTALLRTSTVFARLARGSGDSDGSSEP
ncbi:MAG: MFS transporter, partial [Mesorhizobium sp.]